MFCKKCGKELPDNTVFCAYCGNKTMKIKKEEQESSRGRISAATAYSPPQFGQNYDYSIPAKKLSARQLLYRDWFIAFTGVLHIILTIVNYFRLVVIQSPYFSITFLPNFEIPIILTILGTILFIFLGAEIILKNRLAAFILIVLHILIAVIGVTYIVYFMIMHVNSLIMQTAASVDMSLVIELICEVCLQVSMIVLTALSIKFIDEKYRYSIT